jgi:hypothetical protein
MLVLVGVGPGASGLSVSRDPKDGAAVAQGGDETGRISAALITLMEMPQGWIVYQARPGDTFPLHRGVCGSVRRSARAAFEVSAAFAQGDDTGPVFGERIAEYPLSLAQRIMAVNRSRPYPCHWADAGIKWSAATIPAHRLCDESFAYLERKLSGNFPYSYEYVVRCGHNILAFVLSAEHPDGKLAAALVRKAVDRYQAAGTT